MIPAPSHSETYIADIEKALSPCGAFYLRWRHARGYGVHSQYAYDLLTRAIRPGRVAWYGYDVIRQALGQNYSHRTESEARMLLRIASTLDPCSVYLRHGADSSFFAALRAANSRMRITTDATKAVGCRMLLVTPGLLPDKQLRHHISRPGHILMCRGFEATAIARIYAAMSGGVLFAGRHDALFVSRDEMAPVLYIINF